MPSDVDRYISERVDPTLRRQDARAQGLTRRARERRNAALLRKAKFGLSAVIAILIGATVAGFFIPLGTGGVMVVMALVVAVLLLVGLLPAGRPVRAEALAETELRTLPLQTEIWLESQRAALPPPAAQLVDAIGVKLETLAPQLERLNPQEPVAQDVRRLLSDHLPELVTGYRSIPAALREEPRDGRVPNAQLIEGLQVIDGEIARMTEQLARGDLDSLATQSRFLELKYRKADGLADEKDSGSHGGTGG